MKRACVATIDSARARIYLYQEQTNPGFELVEIADLDSPGRRLQDRDLIAVPEMDARFARRIVDFVDSEVRRRKLGHVVLIAPPKMLGAIRATADVLHRDGLVVEEIDKDLSNLDAPALHDHLAGLDIVPARRRLKAARS